VTYKHLDPLCGGCADGATPITDMQTIAAEGLPFSDVSTSQTSGSPDCPAGYDVLNTDLNKGAGGSYSFLCLLTAGDEAADVVTALGVAAASQADPPVCEAGWTLVPGNLKAGTQAAVVQQLCIFKQKLATGLPVIVGVAVAQGAGATCPSGYEPVTDDISAGVGLPELICARFSLATPAMERLAALGDGGKGRLPASFAWSAKPVAKK